MNFTKHFLLLSVGIFILSACSHMNEVDNNVSLNSDNHSILAEVNTINFSQKDAEKVLEKLINELQKLWWKQYPGNVPYKVPQSQLVNVQTWKSLPAEYINGPISQIAWTSDQTQMVFATRIDMWDGPYGLFITKKDNFNEVQPITSFGSSVENQWEILSFYIDDRYIYSLQGDGTQNRYPNGNPMFVDSDTIIIYDIASLKEVFRQDISLDTKTIINKDYETNYQSKI